MVAGVVLIKGLTEIHAGPPAGLLPTAAKLMGAPLLVTVTEACVTLLLTPETILNDRDAIDPTNWGPLSCALEVTAPASARTQMSRNAALLDMENILRIDTPA